MRVMKRISCKAFFIIVALFTVTLFGGLPAMAEDGSPQLQAGDTDPAGVQAIDYGSSNRVTIIEDAILGTDNKPILKTYISIKGRSASDDDTFQYLTSEPAKYNIAISNEDNSVMNKVVRVYFAYDGTGQEMGTFPVGEYGLISNEHTYPMTVVETEVPNVFYYDITGVDPGETLNFDNTVAYPSPGTPGGTLRIWTKTITAEDAETLKGKVIDPANLDYLELVWDTNPVTYNIAKSNSTVYSNQTPSISITESGEAPVKNLAWRIRESNASGSSSTSLGQDHILRVDYTDIIDLPDTVAWRPEVLEVLEAGTQSTASSTEDGWWTQSVSTSIDTGSASCNTIRVRANGVVYDLVYMNKASGGNASGISSLTPTVVTVDGEKKLKLTWYCTNNSEAVGQSRTAEYSTQNFYLRVGSNVVLADLDKLAEAYEENPSGINELITVKNDASEVRQYSYSDPQSAAAATIERNVKVDTGWSVTKNWKVSPTSDRQVLGGNDDFSVISIKDTGILPIKAWGTQDNPGRIVSDTLSWQFYIKPENIVKMLNAEATVGSGDTATTAPLGDWLTITINHASLFNTDYYIPSQGADQNNKYISDLYANADTTARVFEGATFTITKNDQGRIVVTLSGDTEASNNKTYIIGEGGDYESIDALFDAVGYFPTCNTTYNLSYVVGEEGFTLNPGKTLNIDILGTCKTTPMRLTVDRETSHYYSFYSSDSYTRNTATVSATVAGTVTTVNPSTYYSTYTHHYWYPELWLYKSGSAENGSSYSNGAQIPEGTVIDNRIHGYNNGSYHYDYMQFADYMYGAEVLLVPKNENPSLESAGLSTFTSNGVTYWLMNKSGTYNGVIVGSTTKNGTQTFKATSIVVAQNGTGTSGSLNTTIKWEPIKNWSNDTNIYYKSIASAYWAGLVSDAGTAAGNTYRLGNKAWLGDHQGHRLWDTYGLYYNSFRYDGKRILNSDGSLSTSSRIKNGEKVTYQITITNITSTPVIISGSMLRDALPNTYGVFDWTKDENVTNLRYSATEGSTIKAGSTNLDITGQPNTYNDYWRVESSTNAPTRYATSGSNVYQGGWDILWDSNFQVNLVGDGVLKIYVDLTYPKRADDDDTWDKYVNSTKGQPIYNYFYFNESPSWVSHTLEAEGRPVLYKGVYDTGLTTHTNTTNSDWQHYGSYSTNKSRVRYVNSGGKVQYTDADLKAETITYYTILYNGSYDRLYLSDMQDVLPRGFTFNSFCNTTSTTQYLTYRYGGNCTAKTGGSTSSNYLGYTGNIDYLKNNNYYTVYRTLTEANTSSASSKLVTISNAASGVDENTIKYVNAAITASTSMGDDGKQHITYTFGSTSSGYGNGAIHYDSTAGKYYLNPGEAIRFGYNCFIDSYANTDDLATNTIAMPYYDYYGTGFDLHAPSEEDGGAVQKVSGISGISVNNDGGCELMKADEVASEYGMNTENYQDDAYKTNEDGNWLVSEVTVKRAPMTPGLIKTVGGTSQKPSNTSDHYGSLGTTNTALNGGTASRFGTTYRYSCSSSDIINWRLRLYNEAGEEGGADDDIPGMMSNYKIVDKVASPFGFTGRVFYNMFRNTASANSPSTSKSQYLFVLGRRTEGDTSVRIGRGTSYSNADADVSGKTQISIGSAEDDSDDDWFMFGKTSTSLEGRVKIERDAAGNEVMTIEFIGSSYAIPGGCNMELAIHTQYNKDKEVAISEARYNDSILYPTQGYDATKVAQGRARTTQGYDSEGNAIEVNDGVQSGTSVMLVQGSSTSSWKTVTLTDDKSVTARSDESNNSIRLDEKIDTFRYGMHVVGPEEVMSKIVVIDALPQEGDHSAFVTEDKRYSDFKVSILAENPEFAVSLTPKGGKETFLGTSEYNLYVSEKIEFSDEDWGGEGEGWTDVTNLTGDELASALEGARSLRAVVKDPDAYKVLSTINDYKMANQTQVNVYFNAEVDDDEALPGEYAWNSFGYMYSMPITQNGTEEDSKSLTLKAQPLNVGVRYPAAPSLEKQIVELVPKPLEDEDGNVIVDADGNPVMSDETEAVPREAGMDLKFGFLIYEGSPIAALDSSLEMTNADVVNELKNANRQYLYVPVEIAKGESSGKANLWTYDYASNYDAASDSFGYDEGTIWHWINAKTYSIVELPMPDYDYTLDSIKTGSVLYEKNNVKFDNSNRTILQLVGTNRWAPRYVDVPLEFDKYLYGEEGTEGEFSFTLTPTDSEGNQIEAPEGLEAADAYEVQNTTNGAFADSKAPVSFLVKCARNGEYYYVVSEDAGDSSTITYDSARYMVYVNIVDGAVADLKYYLMGEDGTWKLSDAQPTDDHAFYNNGPSVYFRDTDMMGYADDSRAILYPKAYKVIDGSTEALAGGDFTFKFAAADDASAQADSSLKNGGTRIATNDASGSVAFYTPSDTKGLVFDEAGTYHYTIEEVIPDNAVANGDGTFTYNDVIYDGNKVSLTVEVTEVNGVLTAKESYAYNGESTGVPTFKNKTVPPEIDKPEQNTKTRTIVRVRTVGTPRTGDSLPIAAIVGVAAVALISVVGGGIAYRRSRRPKGRHLGQ